jgi:cell division protein FtsN
MLFEKGDSVRACARLADAAATTPPGQVELRNQIDYLSPRCVGVDTSTAVPVKAAAPAKTATPVKTTAPAKPAAPGGAPATPATRSAQELTVQVAAFSSHESAERLGKRLKELGYDARITSGAPPYRVRVGRYATREAADSVVARMKTQHVDGYVTSAEPRR